jgi:hypothetical protein
LGHCHLGFIGITVLTVVVLTTIVSPPSRVCHKRHSHHRVRNHVGLVVIASRHHRFTSIVIVFIIPVLIILVLIIMFSPLTSSSILSS